MVNVIKYVVTCPDAQNLNYYINLLSTFGDYSNQEVEKKRSYKLFKNYSPTSKKQILRDISERASQLSILDEKLVDKVTNEIYCAEIAESLVLKGELIILTLGKANQIKHIIQITLSINLGKILDPKILNSIDYYATARISELVERLGLIHTGIEKSSL